MRRVAVLVTGSRSLSHGDIVAERLELWLQMAEKQKMDLVVLEGGANGADQIARIWCKHNGVFNLTAHAPWERGNVAGPLRNILMVDMLEMFAKVRGGICAVEAFPGPRSFGTIQCVKIAVARGFEVNQHKVRE